LSGKIAKILAKLKRRTPEEQLAAIEVDLAQSWSYLAYDRLRQMAGNGHPAARYRLGQMFERAEGVIQNLADAVYWYSLAAQQGYVPAQARLGLIYFIDPPAAASLSAEEFELVAKGEVPAGSMLERGPMALG
jgi:TPR repeat protein